MQKKLNKNRPVHSDYDTENYHGEDAEKEEEEMDREGLYVPKMTKSWAN